MNFGKTFCINLPERTDRWREVQEEFKKIGLGSVNRVEAIKASPGWIGCRESHLAVLRLCQDEKRFTIFEDDVQFTDNAMQILALAEKQLPKKWDMLYLGANLMKPIERHSANLYRLKGAYTTHAMIFNNKEIAKMILSAPPFRKIDCFMETYIQEYFNVYIVSPMIATQADGYSDITNRHNNYAAQMMENFNNKTVIQ